MIRVIYTYEVTPGKEDQFIEAWRKVTRETRVTARGSKGAMLMRDGHSPSMFVAVSRWDSLAELKRHLDSSLPPSEAAKALKATLTMPAALQVLSEVADMVTNDPPSK